MWENDETYLKIAISNDFQFYHEWLVIRSHNAINHHTTNAIPTQWNPRAQGFFKCNLDAFIFKNENHFWY